MTAPALTPHRPHVVIIGGGFGGLAAARALRDEPVDVTLIDRRNHHVFQPLLYQVATGALSPANIAVPLRRILRKQRNARVLLADVQDVDLHAREVVLPDRRVRYDHLVIAAGAENQWFGHDEWAEDAPGLKSISDATGIRARILRAFEQAELLGAQGEQRALASVAIRRWLTFVIIGAGPTGVEMAGAIAELARDTLRHDFRSIDTTETRIILIEGAPQVLPAYPEGLARKAQRELERLGVIVRTGAMVTSVDAEGITVRPAAVPPGEVPTEERIDSRTVIWAAGVRAVPLAARVARAAGIEVDRGGRVPVQPDLSLPGHPEVFIVGDMAAAAGPDGKPLPGVAPVAIQGGEHAGKAIRQRLQGRPASAFRFKDQGSMATVGRGFAVFWRGRLKVTGILGWLGWLFIHLLQLVELENRLLVVTQWAWSYLTHNRSARLIVDESHAPSPGSDAGA